MEENKTEETKINFFKKIWYSIGKISKYDEMVKMGPKKAIKYFLGLIALLSLILAITVVIVMISVGVDSEILENTGMTESGYYIYNAIIYYLSHFIVLFLVYAIYILIITASIFIVSKMFKMNETFKDLLSTTIYGTTLSIIVYVIYLLISYFTGVVIPYFDSIAILIVFIYIGLIFGKKRKEN